MKNLCLLGDGVGNFHPLIPDESGLVVRGEVQITKMIEINNRKAMIIGRNNEDLQVVRINK
ncbi:MAG: hypothetical protein MI975_14255 [Cytophagales bacterium]|nr:hypothetical protein [Cytophagales bacterium]